MSLCTSSVAAVTLALCGPVALAADIYLTTGAEGEASFSDFALPDAVTVDVEVHEPSAQEADAARERTAQTLAIAAQLEAARLEREKIYAERSAQAARAAEQSIPEYEEPEHVGYYGYPGRPYLYPRSRLRPYPGRHGDPHLKGKHRFHDPRDDPSEPMEPEPAAPPSRARPLTRSRGSAGS